MRDDSSSIIALHEQQEAKLARISRCLAQAEVNLWELRELALTRGGFVNDDMRRQAWPLLVGLDWADESTTLSPEVHCPEEVSKAQAKETDLIRREAGRSVLFRWPACICSEEESTVTEALRQVLESVVSCPLSPRQSKIHYYQGLHDLAGVVWFNMREKELACQVLRRICASHVRDALREDFSRLLWLLNTILMPLLQAVDEELHELLLECKVDVTNLVMPWIITWCTHDLVDENVASRVVDACLASHPMFVLYFSFALWKQFREEIFNAEHDGDAAMVHIQMRSLLNHVSESDWRCVATSSESLSAQEIIDHALTIMRRHPPRSLLALAEKYDPQQRSELKMAEFVSLLKAPPSWALASRAPSREKDHDSVLPNASGSPTSVLTAPDQYEFEYVYAYARAKVASGISFLMSTVDDNVVFASPRASAIRGNKATQSLNYPDDSENVRALTWSMCKRILFSHSAAEDIQSSPMRPRRRLDNQ